MFQGRPTVFTNAAVIRARKVSDGRSFRYDQRLGSRRETLTIV